MRRAVVTGMGIVCSIGSSLDEVEESLRSGRSGISHNAKFAELGFRGQLCGTIDDAEIKVERKKGRSMCQHARWAVVATRAALKDAGLTEEEARKSAVVIGSGHGSSYAIHDAARILLENKSPRKIGPFSIPKIMGSAAPANISVCLKTTGRSYAVSSACSSGSHAIGLAADLIRWGKEDLAISGGSDEYDWIMGGCFDAMRAFSSNFNESRTGSRPYDKARDGFVPSGGSAILIVEPLERARARGARIYGEISGSAANSDGNDMFAPTPSSAAACMRQCLHDAGLQPQQIDYVNTHGTSTVIGDRSEIAAITEVFGESCPLISSTKSMTGHAFGAAGAIEAVFTLLMMRGGFVAPSINIEELDPEFSGMPIVREARPAGIRHALSNSLGFGGTNAVLAFSAVTQEI